MENSRVVLMVDKADLLELIEQAVSAAIGTQPKESRKRYLTADEAWQYLNLPSKGSLYQLSFKKRITSIKNGKQLRFLLDDLDKYMMSGRRQAKVEA